MIDTKGPTGTCGPQGRVSLPDSPLLGWPRCVAQRAHSPAHHAREAQAASSMQEGGPGAAGKGQPPTRTQRMLLCRCGLFQGDLTRSCNEPGWDVWRSSSACPAQPLALPIYTTFLEPGAQNPTPQPIQALGPNWPAGAAGPESETYTSLCQGQEDSRGATATSGEQMLSPHHQKLGLWTRGHLVHQVHHGVEVTTVPAVRKPREALPGLQLAPCTCPSLQSGRHHVHPIQNLRSDGCALT